MVSRFRHGLRPVWLASYPRSGNTFLRIILRELFQLPTYSLYHVEGQNFRDPSAEALRDVPRLPRRWRRRLSDEPTATRVLIKTHGPPLDDAPAIYLVREGPAAIHSYYQYHQKFAFEQPSLTEVIAGACQFGSWSEHYLAWQPRTRPQTLCLRYEKLVSRPADLIPQIAEFLGVPAQNGRLPTFEELNLRFPDFFRRGTNQDYLRSWNPAQTALFNLLHGPAMRELGYGLPPATETPLATVQELAQSSARLHKVYLEYLNRADPHAAAHEQLADEVAHLRQELQTLKANGPGRTAGSRMVAANLWLKFCESLRLIQGLNKRNRA